MKKVGTFSSACGLIFLGVWMIINKMNSVLGKEIFKWWPAIFIIIGIEVLVLCSMRKEENHVGFNPIIVLVVLIFICVNGVMTVKNYFTGISFNGIDFLNNLDKNYTKVDLNKSITLNGNKIHFNFSNGSINIKKSQDNKLTVKGKIYTDNNTKTYDIHELYSGDECKINFDDSFIKAVDIDVYVPDGCIINTDSNNIKFNTDDDIKEDIILKANNGAVNVKGNCENIGVNLNNGTLNVNNTLCKNVDIDMNNGTINVKTQDNNLNIKTDIDSGVCKVNGESRVNSNFEKTYGTGEDKLKIKADHAVITVNSQE